MPPEASAMKVETPPDARWGPVRQEIDAQAVAVRAFLQRLPDIMEPLRPSPDLLGSLEIILAEVLNNIVEHAYAGTTDGKISVAADYHNARLTVEIIDKGQAMPNNRVPPKKQADIDVPVDDLPEGGFGWFLIYELVEDLCYARIDNSNTLRFSLKLD